ncbi:MAG TPA: 5'-nucleotidase C-terminal domain-containing protein [Thermoanaerobaculia bacterium]|nr:5'-nucleotidase C-terminal domain-containing protein [Thermoanaerobaculia bacterium]
MIRRLIAALTLFAAGCSSTTHIQPAARFKILQINDVYKIEGLEGGQLGGLARVRTLRKLLESDGTKVYVMHGGDALFPSVMSKYFEARPIVDIMNMLDGDATKFDPWMMVGLGNHELDQKDDRILLARLNESQFIWVATNTYHCKSENDCAPLRTVAENVSEVVGLELDDGLNATVIGLLYPITKSYARSTDVISAARDAHFTMADHGSDLTIAITHQDMPDDIAMAQELPGIDIVIGGHDHLYHQQQVGNTWITKADADAKSAIVYDVTIDTRGHMHTAPLRVVLDSTIAKDPAIDARVQEWMAQLSAKIGDVTYGTTKNLLEGVEPAVRGRETALGNLLMDAARDHMGTNVAVLNGGSIRINDNIPPGPIKAYDMEGIFYYKNHLVAFNVTGQQLLDMLRNSVSRVDAGDGRFLQVSGLNFRYHPRDGKFIVDAADVEVGGKPLDLEATYSMATIDFVYTNGTEDGYTLFSDATRPPKIKTELEADFRTTVENYIRAKKTVTQSIEGRIVRN